MTYGMNNFIILALGGKASYPYKLGGNIFSFLVLGLLFSILITFRLATTHFRCAVN